MTDDWNEFLANVPTEFPRTFVRITPLDEHGQPSGLVETFGRILKPAFEGVATVFSALWRAVFFDPEVVRRYAVEVLDITEVDIRRVTDTTIVLWNGRRIPHNLYPHHLTTKGTP